MAPLLALAGCATPLDNQPLNRPVTAQFIASAQLPRDIVGRNVIGLSLSGGGMRAAAFGFGVLQALADADEAGTDRVSSGAGPPTGACVRVRPAASGRRDQDSECPFRVGRVSSAP